MSPPNTSATGGYLLPSGPIPAEDDALDKLFQAAVAAITGLPGLMVRGRWQPGNPQQPPVTTNWCGLSVTTSTPNDGPQITHNDAGDGSDTVTRYEALEVLTSFYGPCAKQFAGILRDGISLPQNMEGLKIANIGYTSCGSARTVPEKINQQWVRRVDMTLAFTREVSRTYATLNFLVAGTHFYDAYNRNQGTALVKQSSPPATADSSHVTADSSQVTADSGPPPAP